MYPQKSVLSADLDWMMQNQQVSDAQLIQVLLLEYYSWLYRMAYLLTGDAIRAGIVVESTLRIAVSNRRRFWGNTTLRAWLAELVLRGCREPGQKMSVLSKLPFLRSRFSAASVQAPFDSPERLPEEHRLVREYIQILLPQDLLILMLRYGQALTAREVAYALHLRENVVLSRLQQLRDRLSFQSQLSQETETGEVNNVGVGFAGHATYFHQLHQALDRSLAEEDQHLLQEHVLGCQVCRTYSADLAELDHRLSQGVKACWPVEEAPGRDAEALSAGLGENVGKTRHQRRFSRLAKELAVAIAAILVVVGLTSAGNLTEAESNPTPSPASPVEVAQAGSLLESPAGAVETPAPRYRPRWRSDYSGVHESMLGSLDSESSYGEYLNFANRRNHQAPNQEMPDVNMSGSVNLHLLLHYWGERGNPEAYLQPNQKDETVMFFEMVDYVEAHTDLEALMRMGGEIDTLKALVEAGIPVIVQKGYDSPQPDGWAGHYVIVNGYDEIAGTAILLAAFPEDGEDTPMPYAELERNWRAFNYSYMVVFPPDRGDEVRRILGAQANEFHNYKSAVERASAEIEILASGRDLFFAWFNLGTSLTYLEDYSRAKDAFDEAFSIFVTLPEVERPWRILWYQTRPYWAFFYTGSYQMVINLANSVLDTGLRPHLEESYYWRAMAKEALGDLDGAIQDLNESIRLNPNFVAGKYQLMRLNGES